MKPSLLIALAAGISAGAHAEVVLSNLANLSFPEYGPGAYEVDYSLTEAGVRQWWGGAFHAGAGASLDALRLELFFQGLGSPKIRLFQTGLPVGDFGFFAFGVDPVLPETQELPPFVPSDTPQQLTLVGDLQYRGTPVGPGVQLGTGIYDYLPDAPLPLEAGRDYVFLLMTDPADFANPSFIYGDNFVLSTDPAYEAKSGFTRIFNPFIYQGSFYEEDVENPRPLWQRHFWHPVVRSTIKFELDVSNLSVSAVPESSTAAAPLSLLALGAARWLRRRR